MSKTGLQDEYLVVVVFSRSLASDAGYARELINEDRGEVLETGLARQMAKELDAAMNIPEVSIDGTFQVVGVRTFTQYEKVPALEEMTAVETGPTIRAMQREIHQAHAMLDIRGIGPGTLVERLASLGKQNADSEKLGFREGQNDVLLAVQNHIHSNRT